MLRKLLFLSLSLCTVVSFAATTIQSPNGKISVAVNTEPALTYSVQYDGKEIVSTSALGLKFKNEAPFGEFNAKAEPRSIDKKWTYPWGRQFQYHDKANEAVITLTEKASPNRTLTVIFRAYDDGVAFRYVIAEKTLSKKEYVLEQDLTEFNFNGNPAAWFATYKDYKSSQEEFFLKKPLNSLGNGGVSNCPVVIQSAADGPYIALTEADVKTWGGLFFKQGKSDDKTTRIQAAVAPRNDGNGLAKSAAPDDSPWRVIIIAKKAVELTDQTIVMNVSTSLKNYDEFAWVKPGKASWDWWSDSNNVMNTGTVKKFIDLAADNGWQYTFVDDPWYAGKKYKMGDPRNNVLKGSDDVDIEEVARYAKEKNVKLFLWLNWLDISRQMDEAFALYEKWGIGGVKIDFMDREDQEMLEWYDTTTKKAAKHHLLVDFHGALKPNGYRKYQPNLITREGVRGNEYNKWSKLTPEHYCTLPYTRLMLGPGDFTPGAMLNRHFNGPNVEGHKTAQGIGTRAHELAISVLYDSPILCLCDSPENYKENPDMVEFYRDLPTVWDSSKGLEGEIGEYFSLLRQKGNDWYYGAITNQTARTLKLPLDFLGSGQYEATIYADTPETDKDARKIAIETKTVSKTDILEVKLAAEGGQAVVFKKIGTKEKKTSRLRKLFR
ncbi:alpha-glucosidase [Planctomycetales bacterium]|nr:alpha-glucosidase [Planctomycetales bacterium]